MDTIKFDHSPFKIRILKKPNFKCGTVTFDFKYEFVSWLC